MKKLLFFIIIITMMSCTYKPVSENTELTNEVVQTIQSADSTNVQQVYVIKTSDYHYYYNEDKVLIEKYNVKKDDVSIDAGILVFLITALVVFIIAFIVLLSLLDR